MSAPERRKIAISRWRQAGGGKLALGLTLGLACAGAGCGFEHYHAAPLAPRATAARLATRSLASPSLHAYIERALSRRLRRWPPMIWTPRRLTLAALFYNPQLAAARANIAVAQAALVTAKERPNPSLGIGPGGSTFPESPWVFRLSGLLAIETAGKRAARMRIARREIAAMRLQAAGAAWRVRAGLRAALLGLMTSERQQVLLAAQARHAERQAKVLQQRLRAGEIARPAWMAAERRAAQAEVAAEYARGAEQQAREALAAAIGVHGGAVRGLRMIWPGFGQPPAPATLAPARLKRLAELNRLDLRQALAEYAVAQARLQSEIALQYPNINLGPGYSYEEANSILRLALTLILPVFNHNQGPIAQAEAQRNQLAAAFLAQQARDRAAAAGAWESYRAAWAVWHAARRNAELALAEQRAAQRIFQQGEAGKLSYTTARMQTDRADQASWQALMQAQTALGALENAVERPLTPAWRLRAQRHRRRPKAMPATVPRHKMKPAAQPRTKFATHAGGISGKEKP